MEAMANASNELGNALERYKEVAQASATEIAMRTTVSAIPYAGGSLLTLWDGVAQRRVQERLSAVFQEMKEHLEKSDSEK